MARSSCAQTPYEKHPALETDPESGVRVRPDLVLRWVALSDPEIRFKDEPPSGVGRGQARWDLWTPPPPRASVAAVPVVRSVPPRQARWLGRLRASWLAVAVGACAVLGVVGTLVGVPVSLHETPSDQDRVFIDTDLGWTEARTSAAIRAHLQTTFRLAEELTVVAWADLPALP
jgi:hypothetical protein